MYQCENCGTPCDCGKFCSPACQWDYAAERDDIEHEKYADEQPYPLDYDEAYDDYPDDGVYYEEDYYPEYDNDCDLWHEM